MKDYEIWHDEQRGDDQVNEYWHGIFFVPIHKKRKIIEIIKNIKNDHKYFGDSNIKFAGALKNKKQGRLVKNYLDLFSHLLISKQGEETLIYNISGKDIYQKCYNPFLKLNEVFGCKLVLFYIPDNHKSFNKYPMSYADRVETTFRMGFKGGAHLLFSSENPINIVDFYFDGHEHHTRQVNLDKITKGEFREYCTISKDCFVDDRQIRDRNDDSKIMMSFVDCILGAWVAKLKEIEDPNKVLFPISGLYERLKNEKIIKNINSKWHKSMSVSKLAIIDEKIDFPNFFENELQEKLNI